ncbi:unnamed protein product [Thelazia callipaeda]|uniref:alpha-glucosidase n=1 Tax=Thelazia callipaeda TaxID=103827 RepID=A0A0N5D7E7_THECL|nr:unnamed protein product [Thelazia callipaeda]
MDDTLLPGTRKKSSGKYEVDRGRHSESYITAVRGNRPAEAKAIPLDVLDKDGDHALASPLLQTEPLVQKKEEKVCGYSLAELERYRNDPIWKTLRWLLFLLFWLLWILMFLAAILIVIFSPGCVPRAVPHWWHNAIVWVPSFQDSDGSGIGDFVGLSDRLENLRRLGIQALWLNPFLLSDNFSDAVLDHLTVDSRLGVNSDAHNLIDAIHDKGMKAVISLPVGVTSIKHSWFNRSSQASLKENSNFSDYYHWRQPVEDSPFISKYNNFSYIHYENRPDWPVLNWQSDFVRQNMFDVISYWIDKGIDGFYLSGIEYLARLQLGHVADWPHILDILRDIRNHVNSYAKESSMGETKQIVLFGMRDNAKETQKKDLVLSGLDTVINYELGGIGKDNRICHHSEGNVGGCVYEILSELVQFHEAENIPAMWEFGSTRLSRVSSRVKSSKQAELLTMVQLLLPGTNSIYYGEEIGMSDLPTNSSFVPVQKGAMQWDDSVNAGFSSAASPLIPVHPDFVNNNWANQYSSLRSHLKTFKKMAQLRKVDETLALGSIIIGELINSAFTIVRHSVGRNNSEKNIYLGAFNFGSVSVSIPILDTVLTLEPKLDHARVMACSTNAMQYYYRQLIDLTDDPLILQPEQGVVFKFSN